MTHPSHIDQPGKLYLGNEFIPPATLIDEPVQLPIRELTTHAMILGMTGTGKTGLGVTLLEEMLLQGVPAIILDPKGDLTNLALSFPNMTAQDFAAWMDADEAERQHITTEKMAVQTARQWRDGLEASGVPLERVRAFHERVDVRIYTPGSTAGIPVNVLQSFNPPPVESRLNWTAHTEMLRERIAQIVSALLGLVGIESDSLNSREHILLASIFEFSWRAGQGIDLPALIRMTQDPPLARIGAFDLNVFYPKAERFELAMRLNNIAASPTFETWKTGQQLDVAELMKPIRAAGDVNPAGKTRASVFYLAHLDDANRQFFVTLLLSQLVMWMRAQQGISTLRGVVYFDEVFGYCPPYPRNPPTKQPLMSIIKQGRAAGLGMILGTQNPGDLDYKGLSNLGTWFIGRLRTGRDRERALEGLEGAGVGFERDQFEDPLSTLPPRTFLLQTAAGTPRFMRTRQTMSYLRGPLTREQIAEMADARGWKPPAPLEATLTHANIAPANDANAIARPIPQAMTARPALPPDVREVFLNGVASSTSGATEYRPHLLASASVRVVDRASRTNLNRRFAFVLPLSGLFGAPDFDAARVVPDFSPAQISTQPEAGIQFGALPQGLDSRWMKQAERALVEHVYRSAQTRVLFNATLKMYSLPDETTLDFRQRCEPVAKERRDVEALKIREKFERRMEMLQNKLAAEHQELKMDRADLNERKREELLTNVESVFNFVIGQRSRTSVARGASKNRMSKQAEWDVRESEQAIARLNTQLKELSDEYRVALSEISDKWVSALGDVTETPLLPRKADIYVDLVALAWVK
ncbi:MAG TPA: DUF853 family protein [Thermoflexales bacterium]|nr:DUF853 family protein [Thermoflexales bacterium]